MSLCECCKKASLHLSGLCTICHFIHLCCVASRHQKQPTYASVQRPQSHHIFGDATTIDGRNLSVCVWMGASNNSISRSRLTCHSAKGRAVPEKLRQRYIHGRTSCHIEIVRRTPENVIHLIYKGSGQSLMPYICHAFCKGVVVSVDMALTHDARKIERESPRASSLLFVYVVIHCTR